MSVPTRGPIFELIIPRIKPDGTVFTDEVIDAVAKRLRDGRVICGELNHPVREKWMSEEDWKCRLMTVDETRAVCRIVAIGHTCDYVYVHVRPVANNLVLFESGHWALSARMFVNSPDASGRKYVHTLVTFDLLDKQRHTNPVMHTLFSGGVPGYTYGVTSE